MSSFLLSRHPFTATICPKVTIVCLRTWLDWLFLLTQLTKMLWYLALGSNFWEQKINKWINRKHSTEELPLTSFNPHPLPWCLSNRWKCSGFSENVHLNGPLFPGVLILTSGDQDDGHKKVTWHVFDSVFCFRFVFKSIEEWMAVASY